MALHLSCIAVSEGKVGIRLVYIQPEIEVPCKIGFFESCNLEYQGDLLYALKKYLDSLKKIHSSLIYWFSVISEAWIYTCVYRIGSY